MNSTIRTKIYTAICCLMGTAALCTALSTSVEAQDAPSKVVRFNDLDITKPAGAKILYDRIKAAAAEVCQPPMSREPLSTVAVHRNCVQKAIDNAVMKVNSDVLTDLRFGSGIRLASK